MDQQGGGSRRLRRAARLCRSLRQFEQLGHELLQLVVLVVEFCRREQQCRQRFFVGGVIGERVGLVGEFGRHQLERVGERVVAVQCGSEGSSGVPSSGGSAGPVNTAAPTKNPATDGKTINVLMVNNPQMLDLQKLTAKNFTAATGITVNYTVLPEGDMRKKATLEFTNQAGQYDVATLSNFEIPIYGASDKNWLADLTDYSKNDASFNQADIFPAFTSSADGGRQALRRAVLR